MAYMEIEQSPQALPIKTSTFRLLICIAGNQELAMKKIQIDISTAFPAEATIFNPFILIDEPSQAQSLEAMRKLGRFLRKNPQNLHFSGVPEQKRLCQTFDVLALPLKNPQRTEGKCSPLLVLCPLPAKAPQTSFYDIPIRQAYLCNALLHYGHSPSLASIEFEFGREVWLPAERRALEG